ncbi:MULTISPECIES: NACHT domain-containing protein [unclassified Streptomyces]|uniref:NACHT domain-containing protein n=1 Tax=unclassified Streptomyces TaxID=2593676 RepID=UPI00081D652B|nr:MULTISPECIES: NACHT domain-containing protein [unclassified Streptomyces]MYR26184.1 NACHT domain-containing protein [Streptomyces sp. SID4945]SCE97480.1 NACHT domain-containing protein [Streptomyces sp. LcepLS]
MVFAETAALRLGSKVAGAAGRAWLNRGRRTQERALTMEELIRLRLPGVRLQREVEAQFTHITNAVFDRLEPSLRHSFERREENSRQAVVDAVADTFAKGDLSDDALFATDVRAPELVRHLVTTTTPPPGLDAEETRLYELLLAECAEYYVRIVRGLPVFEERAVAELLARTATVGAEIARILERLPDRSHFAPEGTDLDAAFRREYLALLSRDLDEVEMFRRVPGQDSPPRVPLSVAYMSLRTRGEEGPARTRRRPSVAGRLDMGQWEAAAEARSLRVESALSTRARVLLRGEAGTGKTTLLRWLAVTAARGAFTGELSEWNGLTPVLVKLREYGGGRPPLPERMLDGVAGMITGIMPRGWAERELSAGRVLLMVDGIDELVAGERPAVRDWLRRLLGVYPDIRVVVTSRPAAARAGWLTAEGFTPLHLDRMSPSDLAGFVRRWHQAVRASGSALPCAPEELPEYEEALLTALKDRAHLQALAGTPLLAAMLCAMHLAQGRRLPQNRMELYRNALNTLVHERDADRGIPSAADTRLTLDDKLVLLRDLAWRLSDNNRSEIDVPRAAAWMDQRLRTMRHVADLSGAAVLDQLRHRSGLLRDPAEDRIDFVHRTFQEYLAAAEAVDADRVGNLVGRAHLDLWRETIVLAAGHAQTRQREELLTGILDRADAERKYARKLRLVAASCQETCTSLPVGVAERVDAAIDKLLPPRRSTDPAALAAVGPSLLRKLPRALEGLSPTVAARTVETVALIGGEEALGMLAAHAVRADAKNVHALVEAWSYFPAERYARDVLAVMTLESFFVVLKHAGQVRAGRTVPGITAVGIPQRLAEHKGVFQEIAAYPHLARLSVYLRSDDTLRALTRTPMPRLTTLSVRSTRGTTTAPDLSAFAALEAFVLGKFDVSAWRSGALGTPPELWHLMLSGCTLDATAPFPFSSLPSLTHVTLDDCRRTDGTPLTELNLPGIVVMSRD